MKASVKYVSRALHKDPRTGNTIFTRKYDIYNVKVNKYSSLFRQNTNSNLIS